MVIYVCYEGSGESFLVLLIMNFDLKAFKDFINDTVSIGEVANILGIVGKSHQGDYRSQNVFCPIHENVNTPHARLNIEGNHIYCFVDSIQLMPFYLLTEVGGVSIQELQKHYGNDYSNYLSVKEKDPEKMLDYSLVLKMKEENKKVRRFISSIFQAMSEDSTLLSYKKGDIKFGDIVESLDTVLLNSLQGYSLYK